MPRAPQTQSAIEKSADSSRLEVYARHRTALLKGAIWASAGPGRTRPASEDRACAAARRFRSRPHKPLRSRANSARTRTHIPRGSPAIPGTSPRLRGGTALAMKGRMARKRRILIIEDNDPLRESLRRSLIKEGHDVIGTPAAE